MLPHHHSGLLRAVRDKADSLIAEVFVSKDSPFVGKSLELMMNSLGIAPSRVIKIRRKLGCGKLSTSSSLNELPSKPVAKSASSSLFDVEYIKRAVPFWAPAPSAENATTANGYAPQRTSEDLEFVQVDIEADTEGGTGTPGFTGMWRVMV